MTLSKSKDDYLKNKGWSSHYFFEHAKQIVPMLEKQNYVLDFGRHVIHLKKNNETLIKFYVHYNGRNREYMTITDSKGKELHTFHYEETTESIISKINSILNDKMFEISLKTLKKAIDKTK